MKQVSGVHRVLVRTNPLVSLRYRTLTITICELITFILTLKYTVCVNRFQIYPYFIYL